MYYQKHTYQMLYLQPAPLQNVMAYPAHNPAM